MISFGLVNAPVRMYAAVSEKGLKFNLLHEPDGGRIGYQKVCKLDDKVVSNDEIVKAFEVEDGEFITLADEDFAAAKPEGYRTITIQDFVPADEIDPIYFERTYFLGPQDGAVRRRLRPAGRRRCPTPGWSPSAATCSTIARTWAACASATAS